jgi:hypothetical protein
MAKCHWLKWRNRWVAKWLGGYCMAENSSSPKYTNAILPLHRLTTTNHHYYHYSHMTILAIKTSRLAEWTFSRQTANTVCIWRAISTVTIINTTRPSFFSHNCKRKVDPTTGF